MLAPVRWGETENSRFLTELRDAATDDLLSIKFNVDGYDRDSSIPTFTLGRIVGTMGPARTDEPRHFILGRQLGGTDPRTTFMPCVVDADARRLIADFGNSIPTGKPGGPLKNIGSLAIGWLDGGGFQSIGKLAYTSAGWYESTAGVQAFPLDDEALTALASKPVAVALNGTVILQENIDGVYVRADQFIYRLSPGDTAEVELYATRYGVLQDGAEIAVSFDPSRLQIQVGPGDPPVATPNIISGFDPGQPIVAKGGRATLQLKAGNPDNPRGYVDGQVYGVRPLPQAVVSNPPGSWVNSWDFISLLVWDAYVVPEEPTWYADMQWIFTQYGHLYPLMDKLIDLTSYEAVAAQANLLSFAFGLPVDDPNSMPVTRDLSPAKREAILRWLKNPLRGTPPPAAERAVAVERVPAPVPPKDELFLMKSGLEPKE